MERIARCIALLLYSSKWITLSSVNCFNTGNAIEKINESATSTKRPRILLPPFYIDCYRLLLFRHFYKIFSTIFYLHNTLAHIVYQTLFVQMTIRVSIPQKHNITRKTYNKQAGAPAPAPLTISLFHSTPPQALPPGSPAPSHPHTSRTTHHSAPQPSHGSPAPYRSHAEEFFHPHPKRC